jgi:tetratricopeptide (TPR) repeat protein
MIGFRRNEEAFKLAEVLEADFPGNFDVQMHLGTWHAAEGRTEKARPCFRRGLELQPDDAYAKNMVALDYIDEGNLPRARELLRGLDVPGPQQAPQSMLALADAYQTQGDHASALEMYAIALDMIPSFAQDKLLRKRIRTSEDALGKTETMLPKRNFKLGKPMIAAAVVLAIVLGFFGFNFYKAKHQKLYVINGFDQTVRVSIDGGKAVEVPARNRFDFEVAEGRRRALVEQQGEPAETIEINVENGFFERFSDRSAFVINPGGKGTLLVELVHYSAKGQGPLPLNMAPPRVYTGKKSFVFRDIDYIFKKPPQEIQMKGNSPMESKTWLYMKL